jgi:hypothetical protein
MVKKFFYLGLCLIFFSSCASFLQGLGNDPELGAIVLSRGVRELPGVDIETATIIICFASDVLGSRGEGSSLAVDELFVGDWDDETKLLAVDIRDIFLVYFRKNSIALSGHDRVYYDYLSNLLQLVCGRLELP